MGVPEDIARIYLRLVPLRQMGIDEKTAIKLACQMEAATREGRYVQLVQTHFTVCFRLLINRLTRLAGLLFICLAGGVETARKGSGLKVW